ncbi:DMT family transporter [Candidatus Jidaibacter acanthamoebae]|nr:DMT family transporter [Candidatus Jidaibacter acanthamoeba]
MQNRYYLGVSFKLLNLLIFTTISLGLLAKSKTLNPIEEFFIICLSGTLFLLPWVVFTKAKHLRVKNYWGYILRALFSIIGMVAWIESLKSLGANEATLIAYLNPLFTLVLASLLGEEKLKQTALLAVVLCILIVIYTLKIEADKFNMWGIFIGFCSALAWSFYEIICKKQSYSEHFLTQAFYTLLFGMLIMIPYVISNNTFSKVIELEIIGMLGILRVLNIICLFLAYKFAPINILAPFGYFRLVFMAVGSFLVFHNTPALSVIFAAIIIIAINIYIFNIQKLRTK